MNRLPSLLVSLVILFLIVSFLKAQGTGIAPDNTTLEWRLKGPGLVIPATLQTVGEVLDFVGKKTSVKLNAPSDIEKLQFKRPLHDDVPVSPLTWVNLALASTQYDCIVSDNFVTIVLKSKVEETAYEKKLELTGFRLETLGHLEGCIESVFVPHFWDGGLCSIDVNAEDSTATVKATRNIHKQVDRFFAVQRLHEDEIAKLKQRIRMLENAK